MIPVNIIYIVLYLNGIQPSLDKQTIKQYIYFILLHYFILRFPSITHYEKCNNFNKKEQLIDFFLQQFLQCFIHVQNTFLNMSVNESREHDLYFVYLNSIQPSHVKHTLKTVYLLHIITLFHFALS